MPRRSTHNRENKKKSYCPHLLRRCVRGNPKLCNHRPQDLRRHSGAAHVLPDVSDDVIRAVLVYRVGEHLFYRCSGRLIRISEDDLTRRPVHRPEYIGMRDYTSKNCTETFGRQCTCDKTRTETKGFKGWRGRNTRPPVEMPPHARTHTACSTLLMHVTHLWGNSLAHFLEAAEREDDILRAFTRAQRLRQKTGVVLNVDRNDQT